MQNFCELMGSWTWQSEHGIALQHWYKMCLAKLQLSSEWPSLPRQDEGKSKTGYVRVRLFYWRCHLVAQPIIESVIDCATRWHLQWLLHRAQNRIKQ